MELKLKEIQQQATQEIETIDNLTALEEFRVKYLGKKGELTLIFSYILAPRRLKTSYYLIG